MPRIIGRSVNVVSVGGLTINELAGNVATQNDVISIAHVTITEPTSEPWLTLDYDEWICVLKGKIVFLYGDNEQIEANAGDTVFVAKGERFRPVFPEDGVYPTEYIPVCLPAFRPDRCIREEESTESSVSNRLDKLHNSKSQPVSVPLSTESLTCQAADSDLLYHMCVKSNWEAAKASGNAYFPPTFVTDGYLTHATAVPARLIETANHFYQAVEGEWVCLVLSRSSLLRKGIIVRDEQPLPVGDTPGITPFVIFKHYTYPS